MGSRKNTNRLLDLLRDGEVNSDQLLRNVLSYMSEDDVTDFLETNDYGWVVDEDDEEFDNYEVEVEDDDDIDFCEVEDDGEE